MTEASCFNYGNNWYNLWKLQTWATLRKRGLLRARFWTFIKSIIDSLQKKYLSHTSRNVFSLRIWKINSVSFLEIKLLAKNLHGGEKFVFTKNWRCHHPKTWKHIHKILSRQTETPLVVICGKCSSLLIEK